MLGALFRRVPHKDRRKNRRNFDRPLKLKVEGRTYQTLDWSLGGFRIKDYHRPLEIGERITGKVSLPYGGHVGDFVAEIVRATEDGDVGVRILEITSRTFVAMAGLKSC